MNFISLDLEFTQPTQKIIQIGAVVGNITTGEILEELSIFINPNEQLSEYIMKLTHIKQQDVDNGVSLKEGYEKLVELSKKYKTHRNCITWGGGDSESLRNELGLDRENWLFGRRWIDAKTLYISYRLANNKPIAGGLAKAMTKFGMAFSGTKHNACHDARNTFVFYYKLLERLKQT